MTHSLESDTQSQTLRYAGFWRRYGALALDYVWLIPAIMLQHWVTYAGTPYTWAKPAPAGDPLLLVDLLGQLLVTVPVIVLFWVFKGATPGKMVLGLKIVDAKTGGPISFGQAVVRYLGYIPSGLVFGLGFLWTAWDPRKQGWHDKLARTVVVHSEVDTAARFET